jgi:hypothetical protein
VPFKVKYAKGAVTGYVASDTLTLAGRAIEGQQFGMVTSAVDIQVLEGSAALRPYVMHRFGLAAPFRVVGWNNVATCGPGHMSRSLTHFEAVAPS